MASKLKQKSRLGLRTTRILEPKVQNSFHKGQEIHA